MVYTGKDVYKTAAAMLFEAVGEDEDFKAHAPALLNLLLAEALPYENAHRCAEGEAELEFAPVIASLDDEIPYCEELCRCALPYGLCACYWQDENNDYRAQDCRGRFLAALQAAADGCPQDIEDVY